MTLKHNLELEDALAQFDAITAKLVLHPLDKETENLELRREHIYCAVRDTYLAASIWAESLERNYKNKNYSFNPELVETYLRDIHSVRLPLEEITHWYARIESRQKEIVEVFDPRKSKEEKTRYNQETEKLKAIRTEIDQIANFKNLLGVITSFAKKAIQPYLDRAEIEEPAYPPKKDF